MQICPQKVTCFFQMSGVRTAASGDYGQELILLTSGLLAPTLSDAASAFPAVFISFSFSLRFVTLLRASSHVHSSQRPQPLAHLSLRQYHADPWQYRRVSLLPGPRGHSASPRL